MQPAVRSAAVLVALTGLNLLAQRSRLDPDVVVPLGAVAALTGARASGLSWDELGLGRQTLARSLPAALGAGVLTGATITAAAALPGAHAYRIDSRYPDASAARRAAFGTIPLSVVVPEEVLFRSVLDASLRRHLSDPQAATVHAVAFGLWHALGATTLADENAGIRTMVGSGRSRAAVGVVGAVLATGLAGVGFGALRRRTGSVLPGVAVHWALNAAAALATLSPSAPAGRTSAGRSAPGRHRAPRPRP